MKVYAFIPARYASTRFPGKPLAFIAGRPMIQHVYEQAKICPEFSQVFVTTDDERVLECVKEFGGNVIKTELEHNSGTDRICEAAQKTGLASDDIIINIQGDQPVFDPAIIPLMIKPLVDDINISMTTVKWLIKDIDSPNNSNHVKVVTDHNDFALYFSRYPIPFYRDHQPKPVFYKHLGFYGYRMEFLNKFTALSEGALEAAERLEQLRALEYGFKIKVIESLFDSLEVDIFEDIKKVEHYIKERGKS